MSEQITKAEKSTQRVRIMRHLREGKTLTSLQALSEYAIIALPTRISELRKRGEPIEKKPIKVINRFGEAVRVMEYSLKGEQ